MNMISMAQVVEWKTGNPKVQGSYLTLQHFEVVCCWAWFTFNIKPKYITWVKFWCFFKFFFIHTFIKFNIHKVLVEACLKVVGNEK